MRKIFIAFLGLVLVLGCESMPSARTNDYKEKFLGVLDLMQEYFLIPSNKKNDADLVHYVGYYNEAVALIKNGNVKLDFTDEKKMINGLDFVAGQDFENSKLVISKYFIDTFSTKYAFHMAVISREVATVYYAKNGGAFYHKDNYYQQGRYTADPYYPLAKFIQELFAPKNCKLTTYENTILKSSKDTFFDTALYNYEMIHYAAFRVAFNLLNDGMEGDDSSFDDFNTEAIKLIEGFSSVTEDAGKYYYLMAMISFDKFYDDFASYLTSSQHQKIANTASLIRKYVETYLGATLERFAMLMDYYDSLAIEEIAK